MKKLLGCWIDGDVRELKLSSRFKSSLTDMLSKIKVPNEFQRATRSLTEFHKFKATEFQFILLYAGPVIFKKVSKDEVFKHFMLLHVACRILFSKQLAMVQCPSAKYFLTLFVIIAPAIYKPEFVIGNVHNLYHLANDVAYLNCPLYEISSYPFENALGKMKKLIRNGKNPLSQLCRRFNEIFYVWNEPTGIAPNVVIKRQLKPDASGRTTIKQLEFNRVLLTTKEPNNTILLRNKQILQINDIYIPPRGDISTIEMCGKIIRKRRSLFTYPCNAKFLQMFNVSANNEIV